MVRGDISPVPRGRDLPFPLSRVLLRQVHLQGHRPGLGHRHPARRRHHRPDRHHHQSAPQGVRLPHVPLRGRLRRGAAVRARRRQGWPAAGDLRGGPVRLQPPGARRDREIRGLRSGLRRGPVLGIADDLRGDGPLDRRHQSPGPARRAGQGAAGRHADRLRRDLHVRHRGLRDRHRPHLPGARRDRSRRRVQGLRAAARRHRHDGRGRLGVVTNG